MTVGKVFATAKAIMGLLAAASLAACGANKPAGGSMTLWTSNALASSSNPIQVAVDGNVLTSFTAFTNTAPSCGANNTADTWTATFSADGDHTVTANIASATYNSQTVTVSGGTCNLVQLP